MQWLQEEKECHFLPKKIRFSVSSAIRMLWRGPSLATLSAAQRQVSISHSWYFRFPETGQNEILWFLIHFRTLLYFPLSVRPFVPRHRRDISTFFVNLMVWTMKTIYFLNAYHLGRSSWPPGPSGPPRLESTVYYSPVQPSTAHYIPVQPSTAHYT